MDVQTRVQDVRRRSWRSVINFASRLPGFVRSFVRSFVRDVQPNQSVQVSAILTPDKKVKRVTFVARGVISDGRGDVHRVVARVSAKLP